MADNIKIVGNIVSTTTVTRYSSEDTNLILSRNLQENFGETGDYIEFYIYDIGGNLLNTSYNYLNYKLPPSTGLEPGTNTVPNTTGNIQTENVGIESTLSPTTSSLYPTIEIDPISDLKNVGYSSGEFNLRYNLFHNKLSNYVNRALFIKEISSDRTEIRLASTTLTDNEIETTVNAIIDEINNSSYYVDYLLNFGGNEQYVAVNIALNKAITGYEVLFKLYEPLPQSVQEKQTLWVVEEKVSPYVFDINLDKLITPAPGPQLRGPNFNIPITYQGTVSTPYNDYYTLVSSIQTLQQTSYHQILNLMATQSVDINVDYTDYSDFVFFGSAYQRLTNFYTKAKQIENYNNLISTYTPLTSSTPSLITEINQYTSNINTIVTQFDGYEHYLYFESSSYAWPKTNSTKPYTLLSTGSAEVLSWYPSSTSTAVNFDLNNYDNLEFAIPVFVKDDENNQPFLTFLNMVGHYFDNIWVYLKAITDINLANNNLEEGISRDLVYERLKSLGVHLYNSQAGESVDQYLIGANTGSSTWDNNTSITGSYLNNVPRKDLLSELYKRIYHNLPLLVKTKGTVSGLEHLITTFGITGSILNVKEFGGATKAELINGYNNDKVRIVSNPIATGNLSGSVLSPFHSLQMSPTSSAEFRDEDTHYVDISFSPETQIDTYISGAIAANNTTWSLDDYIGDPRQLYSSSYFDLDGQRILYFETGVPGYPGFIGEYLDYNGFIRLIQYFDNSLFKMLEDFTPERTSLSTGVTINSPVLERNKAVYAVPSVTNQNILDADYSGPVISEQYGRLYNILDGDKSPFFTGELSGSEFDIHHYFEEANFNPYLGNWNSYNAQVQPTQSINLNKFLHSDYNVLFNNVSQSVKSLRRKKIEYIWGTTGSITSSVELQDSYLTLRSYQISRYEGSQLSSLLYNTYTSASSTYGGDISYGKTATIDRQSYKLGWIQTIPSQSLNFYFKTPINLRYLVDSGNQLTELNSYNNNIFEVQNIYKSGKYAILSITDPNQKRRDGKKLVWKGGYSFDPIIYRENNEVLNFHYDNYVYTSSVVLGFIATDLHSYQFRNNFTPDAQGLSLPDNPGYISATPSGPTYGLLPNGQDRAADKRFTSANWPYQNIIKLSTLGQNVSQMQGDSYSANGNIYRFNMNLFNDFTISHQVTPTELVYGFLNEPVTSSVMNHVYKVTRSSTYRINGQMRITVGIYDDEASVKEWKVALLVEKTAPSSTQTHEQAFQADQWGPINSNGPIQATLSVNPFGGNNNWNSSTNTFLQDGNDAWGRGFNIDFTLPQNTLYQLNAGEYLKYSFYFIDAGDQLYRWNGDKHIDIKEGAWWSVRDTQLSTTYIYDISYTSYNPFFTFGTTYHTNDTLLFNQSASAFLYSSSFSGSNVTSPNYSPIIDHFSIEKGDLIKFGKFQDPGEYYEVIQSIYTPYIPGGIISNPYRVIVNKTMLTGNNPVGNFAILRPKLDETSIILEGRNAVGTQAIGQSLLVPSDASTTLNNNIGNIIKSVSTLI